MGPICCFSGLLWATGRWLFMARDVVFASTYVNKQYSGQKLPANFEAAFNGNAQNWLALLDANAPRPPNPNLLLLNFFLLFVLVWSRLQLAHCARTWTFPMAKLSNALLYRRAGTSGIVSGVAIEMFSVSDEQTCLLFHLIEWRGRVRVRSRFGWSLVVVW